MIAARIGTMVFRMGPEIEAQARAALAAQRGRLTGDDFKNIAMAWMRRESKRIERATHGRLGPRSRARLIACFEEAFLAELGIGVRP